MHTQSLRQLSALWEISPLKGKAQGRELNFYLKTQNKKETDSFALGNVRLQSFFVHIYRDLHVNNNVQLCIRFSRGELNKTSEALI